MPRYLHRNVGEVCRTFFIIGTITAVHDDDRATVRFTPPGSFEKFETIPLFYHCTKDSPLRPNGAVLGARRAFKPDDHVVIRMLNLREDLNVAVNVIGFPDHARVCADPPLIFFEARRRSVDHTTYAIVFDPMTDTYAKIPHPDFPNQDIVFPRCGGR